MILTSEELLKHFNQTPERVFDFLNNPKQRVEVLLQEDCQYHCWINYDKTKGSDGIGLTPLEAILYAMYRLDKETKK